MSMPLAKMVMSDLFVIVARIRSLDRMSRDIFSEMERVGNGTLKVPSFSVRINVCVGTTHFEVRCSTPAFTNIMSYVVCYVDPS